MLANAGSKQYKQLILNGFLMLFTITKIDVKT